MNAQTPTLEPLVMYGPDSNGRYDICHAQHGTHRAMTFDPSTARRIVATSDLLEALRKALQAIHELRTQGAPCAFWDDIQECGRAAIAKATGAA